MPEFQVDGTDVRIWNSPVSRSGQLIGRAVFLCLLGYEIAIMSGFDSIYNPMWNVFGINWHPSDMILCVVLLLVGYRYSRVRLLTGDPNAFVLLAILFYGIYQIAVIVPLSASQSAAMSTNNLARALTPRFQVFIVPFFYWYVLPTFRNTATIVRLVNLSSVIPIAIALFAFSNGIAGHTDNGELRLLWGGNAILFAFVLVTSVELFSHRRTNLMFALVAGLGLVAANHRSAYLVLGFIIAAIVLVNIIDARKTSGLNSVAFIAVILVVLFVVIPSLGESFLSRLSSSLDMTDRNAVDRLYRWKQSWLYFLANPINGSMLSYHYYGISLREEYPPHNFILELLSTEGLVGTSFYIILICHALRKGFRNRFDDGSWQMLVMLVFYVGFCLFNPNFLNNWNFLFFALPLSIILFREVSIRSEDESALVL